MMSNSTLPLGFLHLIQNWSRVASFLYLDITLAVEFFLIGPAGCRDEVHQFHDLPIYLYLIVRVNDKFRSSVSIDKAFPIVIEIHLESVPWKIYQVGIVDH
jgi:hypothetical protein